MKYKNRILISLILILCVSVVLNTVVLFVSMFDRETAGKREFIASTATQLRSTMDYFVKRIQTDMVYLSSRTELRNLRSWYEESDFRQKRNFLDTVDPFARLSDYFDSAYLVHPGDNLMLDLKSKLIMPIAGSVQEPTIAYLTRSLDSYSGERDLLLSPEADELPPREGSSGVFLIRTIRNSFDSSTFFIFLELNEYFFTSLLDEIFIADGGFVLILNRDGDLVTMRQRDSALGDNEIPDILTGLSRGETVIRSSTNRRYLAVSSGSSDTGWDYVYGLNFRSIQNEILGYLLRSGLITLVIAGVFVLASFRVTKELYRPVNRLLANLGDPDVSIDAESDFEEFSQIRGHIRRIADTNRTLASAVPAAAEREQNELLLDLLHAPQEEAGEARFIERLSALGSPLVPRDGDRFFVVLVLLRGSLAGNPVFGRSISRIGHDSALNAWFHFDPRVGTEAVSVDESRILFICRLPRELGEAGGGFELEEHLSIDESVRGEVFIGYSALHETLAEIDAAYIESQIAIEYRTLFPSSAFIAYRNVIGHRERVAFYPFDEELRIIHGVKQRSADEVDVHFKQFFEILASSGMSFHQLRHAVFHLLDSLLQVLKDFDIPLDEVNARGITALMNDLETADSPEQMRQTIRGLLTSTLEILEANHSSSSLVIATTVRGYIDEHFADRNLSLDQIADELHYSVSHISAIFKTAYGETVKNYITQLRLSRAKELLVSTADKVETIGRETGYENVGSFVKIFKAYIGETPKEYRLRNRRSGGDS